MTETRDIQPGSPTHLDWSPSSAGRSLDELAAKTLGICNQNAEWYRTRKETKRLWARILRSLAVLMVVGSGMIPLIGQILQVNGQPYLNPLWASLLLVAAGGAIGFDRLYGLSSGYMRYLTSFLKIQHLATIYMIENEMMRAAISGSQPSQQQIQQALTASKALLNAVQAIVEAETSVWVQDLSTFLADAEKKLDAQRDVPELGSINVTVSNGEECAAGWQVSIDGGQVQDRSGKFAAYAGLSPGMHVVKVSAAIDGRIKSAERAVAISKGQVIDLQVTLV